MICGVWLTTDTLDPQEAMSLVKDPTAGGVVVFSGDVRLETDGKITEFLDYEAYEAMALEQMRRIAGEASHRWAARVAIAHRLGRIGAGETAVVVAVACAHRAEAFACCQFLMDRLKDDVPIWKRDPPNLT
jgi:molybdopterin synthase catalytic subunit